MSERRILPARRAFLLGRRPPQTRPLRPPWAADEAEFLERCTRCGDCLARCPTGVLQQGDGGYPEVRFGSAECTFCGQCLDACAAGALQPQPEVPPWRARAHIGTDCLAQRQIACQLCRDACETRAIRFRYLSPIPTPLIDLEVCTGCGACVAACPSEAIAVTRLETGTCPGR